MGRYTGPACRLCRREGMKLFLKGARCMMSKCAVEAGRPAPGMHGMHRAKKLSDYGVQLREKQRLRRHYGLQEGQFRLVFERALRRRGVTGEHLLQTLETRLDNLVYRLGFATSRRMARQFVTHRHVKVDGRIVNLPSLAVGAGSVIQVKDKAGSREMAKHSLEAHTGRELPSWLTRDDKTLAGTLVRVPTRDEIAPIANEQMVVELYSK
jgi:small subunit ribosomal protein S4